MKFFLAFLLGLLSAGGMYGTYELGRTDGIGSVLASCSNYNKYHIEWSTEEMTCNGPFDPLILFPTVEETNARLYSKANKALHRKERK